LASVLVYSDDIGKLTLIFIDRKQLMMY